MSKELDKSINGLLEDLGSKIRNLYQSAHVDWNVSDDSISVEIVGPTLTISLADWLWYADIGRGPGPLPNLGAIESWVSSHNIQFTRPTITKGPQPLSAKQAAFAIATHISQHGLQKTSEFLSSSFQESLNRIIDSFQENVADEVVDDLVDSLV